MYIRIIIVIVPFSQSSQFTIHSVDTGSLCCYGKSTIAIGTSMTYKRF